MRLFLGLRADLHRTEISQLERGKRVARIDTLVKLAASLGVKPEVLLDGLEWRPAHVVEGGLAVTKLPIGWALTRTLPLSGPMPEGR